LNAAIESGVSKAEIISHEQIVLSDEFRKLCEDNTCGNFGRCWMCPPFIGPIHDLMERVRRYSHGLLYQTISPLEDSFDVKGMFKAAEHHAQVSQRLHKAIKTLLSGVFLHLSCGGCHLCEKCAKIDGQSCYFPEEAFSSMEGYGIDVYNTTIKTTLKYVNGNNTVTYFGIVLYGEHNGDTYDLARQHVQ